MPRWVGRSCNAWLEDDDQGQAIFDQSVEEWYSKRVMDIRSTYDTGVDKTVINHRMLVAA